MEKKINIAELLKDCPSGMELDCVMYENLYFDYIDNNKIYPIYCYTEDNLKAKHPINFTWYGRPSKHDSAKCVIFPKGKTTWEGFHRPFEDGDILFYKHKSNNVKYICIYKRRIDMHYLLQYCGWFSEKPHLSEQFNMKERMPLYENDDIRLATEEEKEKLFQVIKDNGYNWNSETKTLEKLVEPKFKVGDRIKHKDSDLYCTLEEYSKGISAYRTNIGLSLTYKDLEQWELVPNKFDITTLKPFESRVLVRDNKTEVWKLAYWGFYDEMNSMNYPYETVGGNCFSMCIPYEGNEYLFKTNNDCDDYYKTWKYE